MYVLYPTEVIHQRVLLYCISIIAQVITKLFYIKVKPRLMYNNNNVIRQERSQLISSKSAVFIRHVQIRLYSIVHLSCHTQP